MGQPEFKPRLIHTKRGAVFALCCTGYVVTLSVRDVLWHSQRQLHWLLDLDWLVLWHISLPAWVVAGVNLACGAALPDCPGQGARFSSWLGRSYLPWFNPISNFSVCGYRN